MNSVDAKQPRRDASAIQLSDRVHHHTFGVGTVLAIAPDVDADRVHIRFEHHGDKWIAMGMGHIRRCLEIEQP